MIIFVLSLVLWGFVASHGSVQDFKGFDDSILFDIDWKATTNVFNAEIEEQYAIRSAQEDDYVCLIPKLGSKESESKSVYTGPTALALVVTDFFTSACSHRIEAYWSYEVCHGHFIKQYHEEREGKTIKIQEYILGRWDKAQTELMRKRSTETTDPAAPEKLQYTKIEGMSLPYVEIQMDDGTPCELIDNKPRKTRVLYVCFAVGKNEVYSLKETSTCQYEMVILSPVLCAHPDFKSTAVAESRITCSPTSTGAPFPPQPTWTKHLLGSSDKQKDLQELYPKVDAELEFAKLLANVEAAVKKHTQKKTETAIAIEESKLSGFWIRITMGYECLVGGHGWWKYEFCFGKNVRQFHRNKDGTETSIVLGTYSQHGHLDWILSHHKESMISAEHPYFTQFYNEGTFCDKTGKKRQTVVRIKCMNTYKTVKDVNMYLLEPNTCEYVLTVETPAVCELIRNQIKV